MLPVAFLLGHGPRGRAAAARAVALLQPAETVREIGSPQDTEDVLEEIASQVPGGTVLRLVHIVEVEDVEIREGLASSASAVREVMDRFAALNVAQFVVALVDREWDDEERRTLLGLDENIRAVMVISRSNEAAVQLLPEEEECMAADVTHALVASDLSSVLGEERFWLVGSSAVYYRRRAIVSWLVAYYVRDFLREHLLAKLTASDTSCDEGIGWVASRTLGLGQHLTFLDRTPTDSSVIAGVSLGREQFRDVPPELLVDVLRSFTTMRAHVIVEDAREQIDRRRAEHLEVQLKSLEAETATVLKDTLQISSVRRFLECLHGELQKRLESLQVSLSESDNDAEADAAEQEALEQELIRTIRRLPFPAAVVTRTLGFGALGIGVYHILVTMLALNLNFAILGLAVGMSMGIPLLIGYQNVKRRIVTLRERYLFIAERRMKGQVSKAILEAAAREVQELQRGAMEGPASLAGRLDVLQQVLNELVAQYDDQVTSREVGPVKLTRFSILVPTTTDLAPEVLASAFPLPPGFDLPELVLRCLLPDTKVRGVDVAFLDAELIRAFSPRLEQRIWPDLSALMKSSGATEETVKAVLEIRTAPIVRRVELTLAEGEVQRMATRPSGSAGDLDEWLDSTAVRGRLATLDVDSVVQLAIRPVPRSMRLGDDGG